MPRGHSRVALEKSTLKIHRQDLANLIKIWYAYTRAGAADYFRKELWDRKGKWQPVWDKFRQDIVEAGGANYQELTRLLAALNAVYKDKPEDVTRLCTQVLSKVVHEENEKCGPYKMGEGAE